VTMGDSQTVVLLAIVLIVNERNELLVLRRSDTAPRGALTWDLPGGTIKYGEDPAQAVMREAREETGIHLDEVQIVAVTAGIANDYIVKFTYLAQAASASVHLSFEHDRYKWVNFDEVQALNMPEPYKKDVIRVRKLLAAAKRAPNGL